jgi:cytochrome c biogenesis protein CcdA
MKEMYYLSKGITALCCLLALYFASHFWMGSQEDWDHALQESATDFFLARFAFTLIVGLVCLLLSVFVDWLFRKSVPRSRTSVGIEFLLIVLGSLAFVGAAMWN